MKNTIIGILFVTLVLVGCKKYPEGGRVRIDAHRVESEIDGSYRINELLVDNIDSTSSLAANPNYCPVNGAQISFDNSSGLWGASTSLRSSCVTFPTNTWQVSNDCKQILIAFSYLSTANELYPIAINKGITVTWDILRLNKNDLWMGTHLNGKDYYLRLSYNH